MNAKEAIAAHPDGIRAPVDELFQLMGHEPIRIVRKRLAWLESPDSRMYLDPTITADEN
jgi:hypothetical protein|tara:strand:- start:22804 stop:22980 length:177 start_codon:yes stop_codon:yes gene_type:complete